MAEFPLDTDLTVRTDSSEEFKHATSDVLRFDSGQGEDQIHLMRSRDGNRFEDLGGGGRLSKSRTAVHFVSIQLDDEEQTLQATVRDDGKVVDGDHKRKPGISGGTFVAGDDGIDPR